MRTAQELVPERPCRSNLVKMILPNYACVPEFLAAILRRPGVRPSSAASLVLAAGITVTPGQAVAQEIPGHEGLTSVLSQVVKVPLVDYAALQASRDGLDDYLGSLAEVVPETLAAAGPEVRLAFWVNAYNACMLQRVTDNYPIKRAGGIFGRLRNSLAGRPDNSVWQIPDVFTADFCEVAGEERSLDEIEHEIVRPMGDPRIHFAVNCAARSCPHLWPEAYTADRVDEQLDRAVRAFIASPQHFLLSQEHGEMWTLRLNKVLDWFSDDFGGEEGLRSFFAGYLPDHQAGLVLDPETDIEFFDYDWTLNDLERRSLSSPDRAHEALNEEAALPLILSGQGGLPFPGRSCAPIGEAAFARLEFRY